MALSRCVFVSPRCPVTNAWYENASKDIAVWLQDSSIVASAFGVSNAVFSVMIRRLEPQTY